MPAACQVEEQSGTAPRRMTRLRLWLFRGLAILCGLTVFALVEVACCVFGLGERSFDDDPFVGFNNLQPLFELDAGGDRFRMAESRLKFFSPGEFAAEKPPGTKRIFCLGGSTVKGRPFSKETSFTTWLELALQEAQPDCDWEVINCGGISYASYRLTPILQECLAYEPDAFIVCTGHNEFLEDRSYGELRDTSPLITVPFAGLSKLRSFRLLRQTMLSTSSTKKSGKDQLGSNVDAFLDYKNGIAAYHRDDDWRQNVVAHFESNLERMAWLARNADVPIIFVQPPSNLADSRPFKSEHSSSLGPDELAAWQQAIDDGRSSMKKFPAAAFGYFQEAIAQDDSHADTHFELGKLLELLGKVDDAREHFLLAREHDICPLRMIAPLEEAMSRVADRNRVPLLDAHKLLEAETRHGILDSSMLVDHVHPSFKGHQMIAMALVGKLQEVELVRPQDGWQLKAEDSFEKHFDQLPDVYFAKGEQNLANLRFWTQGMADGPPIESRPQQKVMLPSGGK